MRSILVLILCMTFVTPAQACLKAKLEPPKDIAHLLNQNPYDYAKIGDPQSVKLYHRVQSFMRDKDYYDALVQERCEMADIMSEQDKEINRELRHLLLKKWEDKGKKK